MNRKVILSIAALILVSGGLSMRVIPQYLKERDDAYRMEGQLALAGLAMQIHWQQRNGNLVPSADDFVLNKQTTLRLEDGVLNSREGRYRVDFWMSEESVDRNEQPFSGKPQFVARAVALDAGRNSECQWYTLDSAITHASGTSPGCWKFDR